MYDLKLTESYVPAQPDGALLDLTVGDLLREQAVALPDAVAVTAVAADGTLGQSWTHAELLADVCARADRRSVKAQHGLNLRDALVQEWYNSRRVLEAEGIEGAGRLSSGDGRNCAGTGQP